MHRLNHLYYIALSHIDWELPNSRIRLVAIDTESGLHFPIQTGILTGNVCSRKVANQKCKIIDYFHLTTFMEVTKKADEKEK